MPGNFDESKHTRADDGKFTDGPGGGGGGAAERPARSEKARALVAKVKESRSTGAKPAAKGAKDGKAREERNAKRVSRAREYSLGDPDGEAKREEEAIANEDRAREAGHLDDPPSAKRETYDKVRANVAEKAATVRQELDDAQREAVTKLAEAAAYHDAYRSALDDDSEPDLPEVEVEAYAETATALGTVSGSRDARTYDDTRPDVPDLEPPTEPDREAYDDPADFEREQSAYREERAAFEEGRRQLDATRRQKVQEAQAALEALHARQLAAIETVTAAKKQHGAAGKAMIREVDGDEHALVREDAFADHERDDEDEIKDRAAQDAYYAARAASRSLIAAEYGEREEVFDDYAAALDDSIGALKDAARTTAKAVKRIGAVAKRAPKRDPSPTDDEEDDE